MNDGDTDVHTLGVLEAIGGQSDLSQRRLTRDLGVALGLANSYLKRCVRKGWVKIQQVPGNRYLYFLTPTGFAEKSRLSARYLTSSLAFYRKAGRSCLDAFDRCEAAGWCRVALCGISDLAEIAFIRSRERGIEIVGFVDDRYEKSEYLGHPVFPRAADVPRCEAWLVTSLADPMGTWKQLCDEVDANRVGVPDILDWRPVADGRGGSHT
jgi:DNA-binding MarR family transcriptional regulator